MNISLNGFNAFHKGNATTSYNIENTGTGSVLVDGSENNDFYNTLKRQTLDNLLDANYQSILQDAYASSVLGAKSNSIEFSSAVDTAPALSASFPDNDFGRSLEMVAKVISVRPTKHFLYKYKDSIHTILSSKHIPTSCNWSIMD